MSLIENRHLYPIFCNNNKVRQLQSMLLIEIEMGPKLGEMAVILLFLIQIKMFV